MAPQTPRSSVCRAGFRLEPPAASHADVETAIDAKMLAGGIGRGIRQQEAHGFHDLLRLGPTSHRNLRQYIPSRTLSPRTTSVIGVSTTPKQIELVRTLNLPHSRAALMVRPNMPAFAAA